MMMQTATRLHLDSSPANAMLVTPAVVKHVWLSTAARSTMAAALRMLNASQVLSLGRQLASATLVSRAAATLAVRSMCAM